MSDVPRRPSRPAAIDPITRAARTVGAASTRAAPTVTRAASAAATRARRPVAGPPVPRQIAANNRRNAELLRLIGAHEASRPRQPSTQVGPQAAGFSPEAIAEFHRRGLGTGGGRSIGGLARNFAAGGLNWATSLPAQAQIAAEAAIYAPVAGYNALTGNRPRPGRPARGFGQRAAVALEDRLAADLIAAGQGIKADYAHRWDPLFRGDLDTFAARFYDDPFPTVLDVAGAKSIVGRSPNVVRRATRAVAPGSRAGMRADRALSVAPAAEREAFARAIGQEIIPGHGGRYRPPRRQTITAARPEEGRPIVADLTVERPRRPYSGDLFARARQRGVDRLRESAGPRLTAYADRVQPPPRQPGDRTGTMYQRAVAGATRRWTSNRTADRIARKNTRDLIDLFDARAEIAIARSKGPGRSAIARLKPDTNEAGTPLMRRSVEELAFALHTRDFVGDTKYVYENGRRRIVGVEGRGGLTPRQAVEIALRRWEGEQKVIRDSGRGDKLEIAGENLGVFRSIPDELLELSDMSNPAVRRVAAAVEEARRLNANAQLRSVEAGVVSPQTATARAAQPSAIAVGGARWWSDAVAKVQRRYNPALRILYAKRTAARKRGDRDRVRELDRKIADVRRKRDVRIREIHRTSTRETPELRLAREEFAEAEAEMKAEQGKVATQRTVRRVYRAGERSGKAQIRLKTAARIPTSPRPRPRIYSPDDFEKPKPPKTPEPVKPSTPVKVERGVPIYLPVGSSGARTSGGVAKGVRVGDYVVVNRNNRSGPRHYIVVKADTSTRLDPAYFQQTWDSGTNVPEGMLRLTFDKDFNYPQQVGPRRFDKQAEAIAYARSLAEQPAPTPPAPRQKMRPKRIPSPGEARPRGITPGQGKQYRQKLAGEATAYQVRVRTQGASGVAISAATRNRDKYFRNLRAIERRALGFTKPRRPELVGTRAVYTPDRPAQKYGQFSGQRPGASLTGPQKVQRSKGRFIASGNLHLNPALVLHQHERAMQNYTGRASPAALDELIRSAAYIDPETNDFLSDSRLTMLAKTDPDRVVLVHKKKLAATLEKLDRLAEGKFLDEATARDMFTDEIPAGDLASDYVAISKAAADVWTESMTKIPYYDKGLTYWKGGLLALSPRWYVNNTFGLALQYMTMAGPDIVAIRKGNSSVMRAALEKRFPNTTKDTFADELTSGDIPKVVAFGFQTNSKLEEFWRRSALMNRTRKALRNEGVKLRGLSEEEIARLIDNIPESVARDIISDVDFFIGNYRKFSKFERDIVKRIIPFYSWLRVIARITFALPFRSPVRAAGMNVLEEAARAGLNPEDQFIDYYARGAIKLWDNIKAPTWGLNPGQTLAPFYAALGKKNVLSALGEEALGWASPIFQFPLSQVFGVNSFGQEIYVPPGTTEYGQDPRNFNQVTGTVDRQRASLNWREALLVSAFPGQISVIRRVAADGWRPYDTVSTWQLIKDFSDRSKGLPRDKSLYLPESKNRGRTPAGANPYTTAFGIPLERRDYTRIEREARKRLDEFVASQKKLASERARARRRG